MAQSDESSPKLKDTKLNCEAPITDSANQTIKWFMQKTRYDMREGNIFEPFFSGKDVFQSIAASIDQAQRSIDILTWGFDPAIPIVRDDPIYEKSFMRADDGRLIEVERDRMFVGKKWQTQVFSGWRKEDTLGEKLLNALKDPERPHLKVRIVLWYYPLNTQVQNYVGMAKDKWMKAIAIGRNEKESGFQAIDFGGMAEEKLKNRRKKRETILETDRIDMPDLMLRRRHPDAQEYSWQWFYRLLNSIEVPEAGKKGTNPFDRIAVVFRDKPNASLEDEDPTVGIEKMLYWIAATDHQKTFLVDIDDTSADAKPHGYIMGHNSLSQYWSDFPFVHRDRRNEMDVRPYHDFSMMVRGPILADISHNFCEAWADNRKRTLNKGLLYEPSKTELAALNESIKSSGERLTGFDGNPDEKAPERALLLENPFMLKSSRESIIHPALASKNAGDANGQIIRSRSDQDIHGYQEKEIKDAYLHVTKYARDYMLIINQYCQYAKLARHIKYWWKLYRDRHVPKDKAEKKEWLYIFMGTARPEDPNAVFRAHEMANELGCGDQFPLSEKEMYETPKETEKRIDQDLELMKNESMVYGEEGYGRQQYVADTWRFKKEQQLRSKAYADAATPEELEELRRLEAEKKKKSSIFENDKDYEDKDFEDAKLRTEDGLIYEAPVHVSRAEIEKLKIRPLFFMFYTQILEDSNVVQDQIAQQPYVHAKLFVQDDSVFTLGSANLNTRSMAVDSEINLLSDNMKVAKEFRTKLLKVYSGYPEETINRKKLERAEQQKTFGPDDIKKIENDFPNSEENLTQEQLEKIYTTLSDLLEKNATRVEKRERIQGFVAKFNDPRGIVGVRRQG